MVTTQRQVSHDYVRARDGSRIAYRVEGRGDGPTLVFTSGFTASDFYWRRLAPLLAPHARLVYWDLRGHGASSPAVDLADVSVEACVDDLRRVMDAVHVERGVQVAFSLGCQIILEASRLLPARVAALVPILGTYGRPFDHLLHPRLGPHLKDLLRLVGGRAAGVGLRLGSLSYHLPLSVRLNQLANVIGRRLRPVDMKPFYAHMGRIDGPTWAALGLAAAEHSAGDLLEGIRVPTLVISGGKDTFTPQHLSDEMAARIPGAERLHLPEASHTGLLEEPDAMADAMLRFLRGHGLL
jgi:pimeloyl-ACP methyl ester carboxylesterase